MTIKNKSADIIVDKLLTEDFLGKYGDFPEHMNELGKFVYYRTYSRYLPEKKRRETWKETAARATEYNVGLGVKHIAKIGYEVDYASFRKEAEDFFDNMFNLRQFLSGRTLWVGGADGGVADKYPLANFNCSFLNIESWDDFGDMFYLLMVGTGVGFKSTKAMASNMKPIRTDMEIIHEPFVQRYPIVKEPDTNLFILEDKKKAVIHIGDSKEGWVEAIRTFFRLLTEEEYAHLDSIGIFYDYIRPKGARLRTFGGTASGHDPLKEMFEGIEQTIKNGLDPSLAPLEQSGDNKVKVRPIHILDIGNLIGNNVVVGGVRRTAEIFLFDDDDYESMFAKYGINGIWDVTQHEKVIEAADKAGLSEQAEFLRSLPVNDAEARPMHHRRMSNNSVWFEDKPSRQMLNLIFEVMQMEGEPGLGNAAEAKRRRPNAEGVNPCFEILLDSYGVCNLTTVNLVQFVKEENGIKFLDISGLEKAQELSARAGLRMTLVELEIPHWDKVQQRDRLTGTSLTGVKDALDLVGYGSLYNVKVGGELIHFSEGNVLDFLGEVSRDASDEYAKELRVNAPLLVTTVKPEGTISQVANGVSSGLHYSHAPYYIRRIRINSTDPLVLAAKELGWAIHAEVGTEGRTEEERLENARTLVIDFPVKSGASKTKNDADVMDQFDTYFAFQNGYTEHNSSNTISVRPDEWGEVESIVYDNWDNFVGVSFLAEDGGSYELAPYEAISEEEYNDIKSKMADFSPEILEKYETGEDSDLDGMDGCEGGICPIR